MTHLKQLKLISSPQEPWTAGYNTQFLLCFMAFEVMKLIFAVLDVSFNSGHYTVIIKRQFLHISICSFSTIGLYILALVHHFVKTKC